MLSEQLKKIAKSAGEADVPCTFLFGTVVSTMPLKVRVDNRFTIEGAALVTLKSQSNGEFNTHTHKVKVSGVEYTTETEKQQYLGFRTGDKLALLRQRGGQKYLVLGVIE